MHNIARGGITALLLCGWQMPAFAKEAASCLDGVFVYQEVVGGPYVDEWFVSGDLNRLNNIHVHREGKSGSFEATIEVDCQSSTIAVQGTGLLYTSIVLTNAETGEYFSRELKQALVKKLCTR
ncbi:hypothetical protein F0224_16775 [Vibrio coralliilyticus]|uniref:hypothetical protein n=1 Tax=Vibrio coralliilyticus TaxID=190893 RepID=UPI000BAC1D79|nr:hypothetical protein [Vibrio coralliilyticus]NOI77342.1 hypothetical protein [Vibrio coralliilyticus]PAW02855.1 hypothetical protein CKJ79_14275 [Vibrio coralliilyticus]